MTEERPHDKEENMTSDSKSETPASMYDWRVAALDAWLNSKSKGGSKPITMEMLNDAGHLDQFHYKGIEANDEIIELLQVDASDKLLDVGCGIGGPARYISWKTGCAVDGFDIQTDLVEKANEVTCLVGLKERVSLTRMDVCSREFEKKISDEDNKFNALESRISSNHDDINQSPNFGGKICKIMMNRA